MLGQDLSGDILPQIVDVAKGRVRQSPQIIDMLYGPNSRAPVPVKAIFAALLANEINPEEAEARLEALKTSDTTVSLADIGIQRIGGAFTNVPEKGSGAE